MDTLQFAALATGPHGRTNALALSALPHAPVVPDDAVAGLRTPRRTRGRAVFAARLHRLADAVAPAECVVS